MAQTVGLTAVVVSLSMLWCPVQSTVDLEYSRQLAAERAAAIDHVPPETLVSEALHDLPVKFESRVWSMRDPSHEPPSPRIIATRDRGRTFWLNDPEDRRDLALFVETERLVQRLAQEPATLADVVFALGFQDFELLKQVEDLISVAGPDVERVNKHRQEFFAPRLNRTTDPQLIAWAWGRHSGDLEVWTIQFSPGALDVSRHVVEKQIGWFLPRL